VSGAWQDYRNRRRLLLCTALAGAAVFALCIFVARARHSVGPFYWGLAVLVGGIAWGTIPLADFPCPKCGEPFSQKGWIRNLATRTCLHCRHPKWSDPG
jgi:hypothetical protein